MAASIRLSSNLFRFYLGILCWAPLPLASNRPWAWSLLSILCLLLALLTVVQILRSGISPLQMLGRHRWSIGLLGLAPLWATLQTVAVPTQLIAAVSSGHAALLQGLPIDETTISIDPGRTRQLALLAWCYWLLFIQTLLLIDTRERMQTLMKVLVLCGLSQALYGSFMTLSGLEYGFFIKKTAYLGAATGTFVNRNHLAGYLELSLAVGTGLLVASLGAEQRRDWRDRLRGLLDGMLGPKVRMRACLALMVIALVLTRSRMGNVAFFVALPICGLLLMLLQRRIHKGALLLFASMFLIDFLIVGQWFGFNELAERLQSTASEAENRDEVVRDSLPLLKDFMVTGTGLGTYYTAFPQYRGADIKDFYDHAHNDYLELGADLGLIGMAALVLSVGYALAAAVRTMGSRRNPLAIGAAFAAVMAISSLLIHSSVDFNLQIPANAMLFVVLLAFAHLSRQLPSVPSANTVRNMA
jgi:putative inorganic carbon (hco3(-)) transporter